VTRPIERFLHVEAAGGLILLAAAAIALMWANSPWHESYEHLWHTPISLGIGTWGVEKSLHFWINELLMTVFFLVVGLEIKRELVEGALSDLRRAALPIAAAIGGMVVPAVFYFALNPSPPTQSGWGVPMATDIAFAVGVLTLLGKRVPAALRVLLLALAIIDDIGAILVIALFYSSGFSTAGVAFIVLGLVVLVLLRQIGVRPGWNLALPILLIWVGLLQTGVHPTIAGVLVGLMAPTRSWFGREGFVKVARGALDDFEDRVQRGVHDHELVEPLARIAVARREALSPALRVENELHPLVAYGVMPLFALANAGVNLSGLDAGDPGFTTIMAGVILGLVIGKPLGILAMSWLVVRLGLATLPDGVNWRGILIVGFVAGIGFTMAIFIAQLAFADPSLLAIGKLGVLLASAVAGAVGLVFGYLFLPRVHPAVVAHLTPGQVEASSEYWTGAHPLPDSPPGGSAYTGTGRPRQMSGDGD
jgi:NhaA family Na+:H+ antiporter